MLSAFSRARARRPSSGGGGGRGRAPVQLRGMLLIDSAIARTGVLSALSISSPFLVRARGPPAASGFAPGGAGIELWGSFGARRSKPLAPAG